MGYVRDLLKRRPNYRHFADDIFSNAFSFMKSVYISFEISLKFAPTDQIDNKSPLVQIMAWRRIDNKPLPERTIAGPVHRRNLCKGG